MWDKSFSLVKKNSRGINCGILKMDERFVTSIPSKNVRLKVAHLKCVCVCACGLFIGIQFRLRQCFGKIWCCICYSSYSLCRILSPFLSHVLRTYKPARSACVSANAIWWASLVQLLFTANHDIELTFMTEFALHLFYFPSNSNVQAMDFFFIPSTFDSHHTV